MQARLLGSGGFMPTDRRETCCMLVRNGREALAVDAGTGFRRLVTDPELLAGIDRLHVVLTHFHLDHVGGLFYLPALELPVEVWAPGRLLGGAPTEALLHRLLDPPFLLRRAADLDAHVERMHEVEPGRVKIAGIHVETRVQERHASPTLALKLGNQLAYCTDSAFDEANVGFAHGVRTLLHEAFWAEETTTNHGHTAAGEAARIAAEAGVDRLVLIHVNPQLDDDEALARAARRHFPNTEVGRDGLLVLG